MATASRTSIILKNVVAKKKFQFFILSLEQDNARNNKNQSLGSKLSVPLKDIIKLVVQN